MEVVVGGGRCWCWWLVVGGLRWLEVEVCRGRCWEVVVGGL